MLQIWLFKIHLNNLEKNAKNDIFGFDSGKYESNLTEKVLIEKRTKNKEIKASKKEKKLFELFMIFMGKSNWT